MYFWLGFAYNINIKQECDTEQCGVFYRNYEKNMEIDIKFGCYSFPEDFW